MPTKKPLYFYIPIPGENCARIVPGRFIKLDACPDIKFAIHEREGRWSISHYCTGLRVAFNAVKENCIRIANERLAAIDVPFPKFFADKENENPILNEENDNANSGTD